MRLLIPQVRPVDPAVKRGRRRIVVLGLFFALGFTSIGIRLADTVVGREVVVPRQATQGDVGPDPRRADIVDRNGELLATNLRVPSVFADPSQLTDIDKAAERLASVLPGTDAGELKRRFRASKRFAWVTPRVTPAEQEAVLALGIPGVGFRYTEQRIYPRENLASHVIGYVDVDNQGLAGIEYGMQARLAGGAEAGNGPLELSLDMRVQQIVHEEVARAYRRFQAKGAVGIVMDRETGELLSLVSLPDFDPNRLAQASTEGRKNRATGNTYELGSLFKILSVAMALDTGRVGMDDMFDATLPLKIGRYTIRDDHARKRPLSVPEIFSYSSNIGTAKMVFAAGGAEPLKSFFERAGMMQRPVLEVPELARPQLPKKWPDITTATTSFGHGIAVTPLQFVEAVAAISGDGTLVRPTVLKRAPGEQPERTQLVSEKTADALRYLMWLTVEKGTATTARGSGYMLGGKTGTADKVDPVNGGYLHGSVLASFVGVFPMDAPRYVVLVMLDDPRGDAGTHGLRYGGWTAAPVVRDIVARIGPVLGLRPSAPVDEAMFLDRFEDHQRADVRRSGKEQRLAAVVADP